MYSMTQIYYLPIIQRRWKSFTAGGAGQGRGGSCMMHVCAHNFFCFVSGFGLFWAFLRGVFVVIFPIYALFTSTCMT